jgi:hypothetical protein
MSTFRILPSLKGFFAETYCFQIGFVGYGHFRITKETQNRQASSAACPSALGTPTLGE